MTKFVELPIKSIEKSQRSLFSFLFFVFRSRYQQMFLENMVLFIESVVLFVSIYTQPLYCTTVDNHVLLRYEFNYVQSVDAS